MISLLTNYDYWYITLPFMFFVGACWGSFLNVCIIRIPIERSIVHPRSRCMKCGTMVAWYDNIPLFSIVWLAARCRHCGQRFSYRYFWVELLTALVVVALFIVYGPDGRFLFYLLFLSALIVITFIDISHRIIPNVISIPGTVLGVLLATVGYKIFPFWPVRFLDSVLGVMVGGGSLLAVGWVYTWITGREGIGLGDVKLLAMIGAFFGWQMVIQAIFFSSMLGALYGGLLMLMRGRSSRYPIPFGPFIAAGTVISIWWGNALLNLLAFQFT